MKKIDSRVMTTIILGLAALFVFVGMNMVCGQVGYDYCRKLPGFYDTPPLIIALTSIFIASLMINLISNNIHKEWHRFSISWFFVSMAVSMVTPSGGNKNILLSDGDVKLMAALLMWFIYFSICISMLVVSSLAISKKAKWIFGVLFFLCVILSGWVIIASNK